MRVCDLCGRRGDLMVYSLPMKKKKLLLHDGQEIGSRYVYSNQPMDVCTKCADNLADLLYDLRLDNGVIDE